MSLLMALVTPIGYIFSNRFEWFVFFYAVSAIDIGFWIPSYTSYVTEVVEHEKRSTVFGKLDAYSKFSGVPAAWVAGVLYEKYGFYAPMYVQIGSVAIVFLIILGLKEPKKV